MNKRAFMRRKLNSKGMTLVEVIVAMAILAVVVVPTLRMFISASSANHTSRLRQRATMVGESVFESFKAYSMEELCQQFKGNSFAGVSTGGSTTMSVDAYYGNTTPADPLRTDGKLNTDATAYQFKVNNAVSEMQSYDVVVDVTPKMTPTVLRTESISEYSDAIISLPESFNEHVLSSVTQKAKTKLVADFSTLHPGGTNLVFGSASFTDFKREFVINVVDDGARQQVALKVTCQGKATVSYTYKDAAGDPKTGSKIYPASDLVTEITLPDASSTDVTLMVYDNDATIKGANINGRKCKLDQVFVYYYPLYHTTFGTGSEDVFTVNCDLTSGLYNQGSATDQVAESKGTLPLKFTIAKQLNTSLTTTELNQSEVNYKVSVIGTLSGGGNVDFMSNLAENLSPLGSAIASPSISGFTTKKTIKEGVVDTVPLLYDVTIHLYEAGTTKEVALFEGTVNG